MLSYLNFRLLDTGFFAQFAERCLNRTFTRINAALRHLPGFRRVEPFADENLIRVV